MLCYGQRSEPILHVICIVFMQCSNAVRYPRAPFRYPCCLLRTAFGTHSACYLHSFCIHCNMLFGTQGPRSAPEGAKLRDPYRKSRLPLWPVNNLTAKVGGTGPGWRLIQDHQHSIVWGARPPKWCLFPPHNPTVISYHAERVAFHNDAYPKLWGCVRVCLHLSARKLCSATVRTRAWQHLIKFTVWFDRRIFLTDWKSDQSVKKKNCQKCVCIFLCLVVFEEERDTLNRKTVLDF